MISGLNLPWVTIGDFSAICNEGNNPRELLIGVCRKGTLICIESDKPRKLDMAVCNSEGTVLLIE